MAMLVRHVMTEAPKTLGESMSAADAAGLMAGYDIGTVPVLDDDGRLVGIVTDRDIVVRVVADGRDPRDVALGEIATRSLITVTPDAELADALRIMTEHRIRRLPVVKREQLVGVVAIGDLAVADASKRVVGETLAEISESPSTLDVNDGPVIGTPHR